MLEKRHNTHALSSYNSSSNNHSYEFENKNKKEKYIKPLRLKDNNTLISKNQIKKINEILYKYNLISDRSSNQEEKIKPKIKKFPSNDYIQSTQSVKKKRRKNNSTIFMNIFNIDSKEKNKRKDVPEFLNEEQKNDDFFKNKYVETKKTNNQIKEYLIYKNTSRETRINNIKEYLEEKEEEKRSIKKGDKKSALISYHKVNNSRNLLRSIKKPEISFITKIFKSFSTTTNNYNLFSGLRLNVKNNLCFLTKKLVKRKEFIEVEKNVNKEKYKKLKKEMEEEKIPTFSSIESSSSNNSSDEMKIKAKTKLKPSLKKKTRKHKTTVKSKSPSKKKKLFLFKNTNKPIRSISVHSKFSNDSSKQRLTNKITNMKKLPNKSNRLKKKDIGINKNIRKYSIANSLQEKLLNKNGLNNNFNRIKSARNLSPFRNNLININKPTDENFKDKDKQNGEADFKKFLDEQRIKRNNQIRNFIKKQGMNSYNFFFPKEPSPLLSLFKNKYSVYPTLNVNRKNSLEKEEKHLKEINKTNYINSATYRNVKISLKKMGEQKEKDKKKEINKIHYIDKHYGNEKDCPICRLLKLRREKDESSSTNNNYIRLKKYNKLKVAGKHSGMFSPIPRAGINLKKDFELVGRNRNRIKSAREFEWSNEDILFNKNYRILYEYLMQ